MADAPAITWSDAGGALQLSVSGKWTTGALGRADWARKIPKEVSGRHVAVSLGGVSAVDSNGALALARWLQAVDAQAGGIELREPPPHLQTVVSLLSRREAPDPEPKRHWVSGNLEDLGRAAIGFCSIAVSLLSFLGQATVNIVLALLNPTQLRGRSVVHHMQQAGVAALPIVGLLSFLIGVVTAYQGADQLARFGAEIFTVNVVGVGVLREMGALITAIVVAGRSASAFAAQIGTMKINEEVDALRVIGIDPMAVLVVPRVLALILIFPFLVVFANAMGVLGGAIMATIALDISFSQFASQFQDGVPLDSFWIGLSKAPLFAGAIAGIGCYQGLLVGQGAAAVGEKTTAAVVQAVFLVIVIDALMSIVYSILGV